MPALLDSLAPVPSDGGWLGWVAAGVRQRPWLAATVGQARVMAAGAVTLLLTRPLAYVYLYGPRQLGMWGGMSTPDICASLSGSPAEFWSSTNATLAECDERIARDFHGWLALFGVAAYYTLLTAAALAAARRLLSRGDRRRPLSSPIFVRSRAATPPSTQRPA